MIKIEENNSYLVDFTCEIIKHIEKNIIKFIKEKRILGCKQKYSGKKDTKKYVYSINPDGTEKRQIIKFKFINETREKPILEYLKNNLKFIIEANPDNLQSIIKDIHLMFPDTKDQNSNIFKIIKYIFVDGGYESKISKSDNHKMAYKLVEKLGIKTCPYCNRSYISFIKNNKKQIRPQLDHFYPKALYPFLACSFYNLIPSCSTCNLMKSDDDSYNDKLLSPYDVKENAFVFSYTLKNLDILKSIDSNNIQFEDEKSIRITLDTKYTNNNTYFQLEEIYQNHKDIVIELILKEINYPKSYIDELIKNGFGTEKEIYRFIFSNYLDIDDLHKRPLSKLTRDIVKELGLLYKIELAIKEKATNI